MYVRTLYVSILRPESCDDKNTMVMRPDVDAMRWNAAQPDPLQFLRFDAGHTGGREELGYQHEHREGGGTCVRSNATEDGIVRNIGNRIPKVQ